MQKIKKHSRYKKKQIILALKKKNKKKNPKRFFISVYLDRLL